MPNSQAMFTLQWESKQVPTRHYSLQFMVKVNSDDESLRAWLWTAKVGDVFRSGGGSAPLCIIRRVA